MISVIIPTRNRIDDLNETLLSILNNNSDKDFYEVIIVNNGDHEPIKKLFKDYKTKFSNISLYHNKIPGLHHARHTGYFKSKGKILAFIDDDVILNPDWISSIEKIFLNNEIVLATGACIPLFSETDGENWFYNLWSRKSKKSHKLFWPYSVSNYSSNKDKIINPNNIWGCNFLVRKSLINECDGFHPDGLPESRKFYRGDGESYVTGFALRKKYKAIISSNLNILHKVNKSRSSINYMYKRGYNEGISQSYIRFRNNTLEKNQVLFFHKIFQIFFKLFFSFYMKIRKKNITKDEQLALKLLDDGIQSGKRDYVYEYYNNSKLRSWVGKKNYYE